MFNLNLAVLASGSEYNLNSIKKSIDSGILPINISVVVCNKKCKCLDYCKTNKINVITYTRDTKKISREQYDQELVNKLNKYNIDMILVFEWTYLFTSIFTRNFNKIIKINRAYSNVLGGVSDIDEIFNSLVNNRIKSATVNLELINTDSSRKNIISEVLLPYQKTYTKEDFMAISRSYENMCLIKGLIDYIENQNKSMMVNSEDTLQKSNFKTMRNIGYDRILVEYSNNEYACGIKRCKLKNKGKFVSLANKWWMNNTKSIVNNHYIWSDGKFMVIKKTKPIKYIFEVHGFLANTFNTKLYDLYKNGARKIITSNTVIPDELNEFSKLDTPIINIINKVSGKSIQLETLVNDNIINKSSAHNITRLCHKLYEHTYRLRDKINLTLACAQYEFGIDEDNNIILIDDIHSYNNCVFWENQEECYSKSPPNIFNSNVVYNWLIQNCHDIDKDIPVIPKDIIKEGEQSYSNYISRLYLSEDSSKTAILNTPFRSDTWTWTTAKNIYLNYNHDNMVCIVTDNKDSDIIKRTLMLFKSNNIYANIIELSPYRDVIKLISHVKQHDSSLKKMVWVSLSRDINPICGIISANTKHPVINCPVSIDNKFSMQSLLSSIQQYKDSPVMTILDFNNLPGACSKIFSK